MRFLCLCCVVCLSAWVALPRFSQANPPSETSEQQTSDDAFINDALRPFWRSRSMREPLLFIQYAANEEPRASLLFRPSNVIRVDSATRDVHYEPMRDYVIDVEKGTLRLPAGSRIPFKTLDELYPLMTSDSPKIARQSGDKTRGVFFDNADGYHRLQVEATYEHDQPWTGYTPQFEGGRLGNTLEKLRSRSPFKVILCGDSISAGYNASKFTRAKPGCPAYGELVASGLERHYGGKVEFTNYAVNGWNSVQGLRHIVDNRLGEKKPELVILAFGMNDVFGKDAATFQNNVRAMMEAIRKDSPQSEFILVASMLGNADWGMPMEEFARYRDSLKALVGPGVAFADLTTIWEEFLRRKTFYDLTGNGVNHPNDFGHIVYAQAILALLIEAPDDVKPTQPPQSESRPRALLQQAERIVFLGDSITYAGEYITFFEAWLLTQGLAKPPIVLNLGLPSETVSGLSEDGHADGKFPRPDLAERLARVLAITKPDLVFACYGINCGIYQSFDDDRFQKYQRGIRNLKQTIEQSGATLVLITPPDYDESRPNATPQYNSVLDRYSEWLMANRDQGWLVVDLHSAMAKEAAERRKSDGQFTFQPDAVHPNTEGHWFIARQLFRWFGDHAAANLASPQALFGERGVQEQVFRMVQKRAMIRRDAYLTASGHKRPGITPGLPLPEAEAQAQAISRSIAEEGISRP
jgi:lysophospholipase L1-like esterase